VHQCQKSYYQVVFDWYEKEPNNHGWQPLLHQGVLEVRHQWQKLERCSWWLHVTRWFHLHQRLSKVASGPLPNVSALGWSLAAIYDHWGALTEVFQRTAFTNIPCTLFHCLIYFFFSCYHLSFFTLFLHSSLFIKNCSVIVVIFCSLPLATCFAK